MLCNGLSSGPTTSPLRGRFPVVTVADNVRLQRALLTDALGVDTLALAYGYSMGAMQALPAPLPAPLPRCPAATRPRAAPHPDVRCPSRPPQRALTTPSSPSAQALHWAAMYPSSVRCVAASCGTSSCGQYNAVFIEGLLAVLAADPGARIAPCAPRESARGRLAPRL